MRQAIRAACAALAIACCAAPARADGDAAAGQRVFNKCKACHAIDNSGRHKIGPNLMGMFGRKAGTAEGFKYSSAMAESGLVWTEETLDKYLENPKAFMPQNRMAFIGLKKEDERRDVIAYLKRAAGTGS